MFWCQAFGGLVEGYRDTKEQLLAISSHYFTVAKNSVGWLRATATPKYSSWRSHLIILQSPRCQEFTGLAEGYRDTKEQLLAISIHYIAVAKVRTPPPSTMPPRLD